MANYKEISKMSWHPPKNEEKTVETIKLGALLRIADAAESMALNYNKLLAEVTVYKEVIARLDAQLKSERHRSAQRLGRIRAILKAKGE